MSGKLRLSARKVPGRRPRCAKLRKTKHSMPRSAMRLFALFSLAVWSSCASIKPVPEAPPPVVPPPRPPILTDLEAPADYAGAAELINRLARQIELWEAWGRAVLELLTE